MKIMMEITWSKFMALIVLGVALYLDIVNTGTGTFQYAMPFVLVLITGKQVIDWRKKNGETK